MTPMTPEHANAAADFLTDRYHMLNLTGPHEGHTLRQHGRCIVCSCGARLQGFLARRAREQDPPD